MPRIKDMAIVLRESDWSETSQVVTLLSLEHGKIRGLAKGSKRQSPSSVARYSGGIEPLTRGQVVGSLKPITGLSTLTEWDLMDPYPHLRRDLKAMHLALYAVDLANALLPDHEPHPEGYQALSTLLTDLANPARGDVGLLQYQWSMLASCGYAPVLQISAMDRATGSNRADDGAANTWVFDPRAGGVVHEAMVSQSQAGALVRQNNGTDDPGAGPWKVRRATLNLLAELAGQGSLPQKLAMQDVIRANRLLCAYARHVLERELPTMGLVLRQSV